MCYPQRAIDRVLRCAFAAILAPGFSQLLFSNPIQIDPGFVIGTGASSTVSDLVVQPDGSIWISGSFSSVNGVSRNGVAKLAANGTVDTGFVPPTSLSGATRVVPLSGGKLLVGLSSVGSGSTLRQGIARLHVDGTVDTSFNAGTAVTSSVNAIETMSDGRILVGGTFSKGLVRLSVDGVLDPSFVINTGGSVNALHLRPDGKIMVGGSFTTFDGIPRAGLCRLHENGGVDTTFGSDGSGPGSSVFDIKSDTNGNIIAVGSFSVSGNPALQYVARFSETGVPDRYFTSGITSTVHSVQTLADGRILIGGDFTSVSSITRQRIALLHADGKPDATFDAASGASSTVRRVAIAPDGKVLMGGSFSTVAGASSRSLAKVTAPVSATRPAAGAAGSRVVAVGDVLTIQGSNLANVTGVRFSGGVSATYSVISNALISVTVPTGAGGGPITLKSAFTDGISPFPIYPMPLAPGTIDPQFDPGSGAGSTVYALARDASGRILAAGDFSTVNGIGRNGLARFLSNGSVDPSFNPPSGSSSPRVLALQADGKILAGGFNIGGKPGIARLNADGSLDNTFNASAAVTSGYVYAIALQADGKILIGGSFTRRLARLNQDGTPDTTFDVGSGASSDVNVLKILADGKIVIGGSFTTYNGISAKYLARTQSNGVLDPTFQVTGTGISSTIEALAVLPGDDLIVGGSFYSINGKSAYRYLSRLRANGALDEGFLPEANDEVLVIEPLPDGRIAIGGGFTSIKGSARNYCAILHADGQVDAGFNTLGGPSSDVNAVLPGADAGLVIGGSFTTVAGISPSRIARLAGDGGRTRPAVSRITPDSGTIGSRIVVRGSRLAGLTSAEFGGGVSAVVIPVSETEVQLDVSAGAMSGRITLRNLHGQGSSGTVFRIAPGLPHTVTTIPSVPVAIGETFTITGTHLHEVSLVRIGVLNAAFTVVSATEMSVTVPPNAVTSRVTLTGPSGPVQSATELMVIKAPPVITSAATATGMVGQAFNFTVNATNSPVSFTASPLPAGLVFDPATRVISGVPTAEGVTICALTATNGGGTTTGGLTITIAPQPAPVISITQPALVPAGGRILVSGDFLLQTTAVSVGGVNALFEILNDDRISIIMPPGITGGLVSITTPKGQVTGTVEIGVWDFQAGSQTVTGFGENSSGQQASPSGLDDVIAIAAGQFHSLALRADGRVTGWGADWAGQLTPPGAIAPASAIAAGGHHSLALLADGTIAAWGRNDEGQCTGAAGLTDVAAVAAGSYHSLALLRNGTVRAWGSNSNGQTSVPSSLGGVVAIAAGGDFSLALKADGTLAAWGSNSHGQIRVPASATGIVAVTAGLSHTAALKSDGTVVCWGANWSNQSQVPAGLGNVTALAAGSHHTVALRGDGTLVAWGANWSGQGTPPAGITNAIAIAANGDHSLVLRAASPAPMDSTPFQKTGKPGVAFSLTPTLGNNPTHFSAEGLPPGLSISSSTGAVTGTPTRGADRLVTVVSRNAHGLSRRNVRLLIGPFVFRWGSSVTASPIPASLDNVVQVAAGYDHSLALLNNGTVVAWGSNGRGQTNIPAGLADVVAVAAGDSYSLALKSDGSVHGWGYDPNTNSVFWKNPIATNVVAIDAVGSNATAVTKSGTSLTLVSRSSSGFSTGSELIASRAMPSTSFSSFNNSINLSRNGFLSSSGFFTSNSIPFDQFAIGGGSATYPSSQYSIWGITGEGKLVEMMDSYYYSSSFIENLRPEITSALKVTTGNGFACVLNTDATAIMLGTTPDPSYPGSSPASVPPQSTSESLVGLADVAAVEGYILAIKDPVARERFVSPRVLEGRAGQSFYHQTATSGGSPVFSATLLPTGLSINSSTGLITGVPTATTTSNFLVIARYPTYFITQVVSLRTTQGLAPLNLTLGGTTIPENLPANSLVGNLSTLDYTPSETFTYSLVSGSGSTDNSNFKITGSQLLTGKVLDFETKPLQFVRIRVTDSGRNTFERVFQITVTGVSTDDDDKDGLTEAEEILLGTDAKVVDSDQDGAHDGIEVAAGTLPMSATSKPGTYVAAWGLNADGQCGVPVNLGPVIAVAAGGYHSLALREDGTVAAWGSNTSGQCDVPPGLMDVVAIAAKGSHSIALKADGSVVAWGNESYSLNTLPTGLADVVSISAGEYLNTALKSNGDVVVWGSSSYDLDNIPTGAAGSVWLAAGNYAVGTLNRGGAFVGWGSDWSNQLSGPRAASSLTCLAAGSDHFIALNSDGLVQAWGSDTYDSATVPAGLEPAIRVGAGSYLSLAIHPDGRLSVWGKNTNQQAIIPAGIGNVHHGDAGYEHVVALVRDGIPDHFTTRSIRVVLGIPLSRQLSYAGMADRFEAMFVPPGLAFNTTTGALTGTPSAAGSFNMRVTAVKGYSRVSQVIPVVCDPPRSFHEWKSASFAASGVPSALTGDLADADGDDLCNLLEYALQRDPLVPEQSPPVETKTVHHNGISYLALSYERMKGATDLREIVEVSGNLATWQSGPAATVLAGIVDHGDTETVTVRDATPITGNSTRFIRLMVERISAY